MAVVTKSRPLMDAAGGNPTGVQAPVDQKCTVLDQSPVAPALPIWLKIRLDNVTNKPEGWISSGAVNPTRDTNDGPIDNDQFADHCVTLEQVVGGSSLYIMAVAELRTRIIAPSLPAAPDATTLHGPFALTTADWDFGLKLPGVTDQPSDIDSWRAQCNVFNAMAQAAQSKLAAIRAGLPSFIGLYLTQVVGASIASSLLGNPNQKVSTLLAAATPADLAKEGVNKASVLTQYSSVLSTDVASAVISGLTNDMQKAIDTVVPSIQSKGGTVTDSADSSVTSQTGPKIAWGGVVNADFKTKVCQISADLGCDPSFLMAAMAFETGERFTPNIVNPRSGATGLIQFMPNTAINTLHTTTAALANMTAVAQLDFVKEYMMQFQGKFRTLSDVYMAIFAPAAVGKPESTVLYSSPSQAYLQNKPLDVNNDGVITKAEAASFVQKELTKGLAGPRLG
jgi:hypothetical protein